MNAENLTDVQLAIAFDSWDEGAAYWQELHALTMAQQIGNTLCTLFSLDMPAGFDWARSSPPEILELATRLPWRKVHVELAQKEGLSIDAVLAGIEYFRSMNEEASTWVRTILKAFAGNYDLMRANTDHGAILEWLNQVTYEMPELMRRRYSSPVFFGQICQEMERHLLAIQAADSSNSSSTNNNTIIKPGTPEPA